MFTHLRNSGHGLFTRLMLILLVLSFVVWGVGDMFHMTGGQSDVARVGNAGISMQQYKRSLSERQEELRRRLGKSYTPELAKALGVEKQALDMVVNQVVLQQEAAALGFLVGDADIAFIISQNANFLDDQGRFSKTEFQRVLRTNGIAEQRYVQELRADVSSKLMLDYAMIEPPVPEELVEALYHVRAERRTLSLLPIPLDAAGPVPEPTEADLKAYYDANAASFRIPETRTATYITMSEAELEAGITVSEEDTKRLYEERRDSFAVPERRELDQLVFEKKEDAQKAEAELKAGKTMAELAAAMPVFNKDKLAMGSFTQAELPIAPEAVFALKEGAFTEPKESALGWHIIRVVKILPPGLQPYEEVRAALAHEQKGRMAQDVAAALVNKLEDGMAGGSSMTEAANVIGRKAVTVGPFTREGQKPDGGKAELPFENFAGAAFNVGEKEHSSVLFAPDGTQFMLQVDKVTPEASRPLAEVKDKLAEAWKLEQRAAKLKTYAATLAREVKEGKQAAFVPAGAVLRMAPTVMDGTLKGRSLPAQMMEALFALGKPGEVTDADPAADGTYVIAKLEKVTPAPKLGTRDADTLVLDGIRAELREDLLREVQYQFLASLRAKYPLEMKRDLGPMNAADYGE